MKHHYIVRISVIVLFALVAFSMPEKPDTGYGKVKIKWERERIAGGLVFKHSHTVEGDTLIQNLNMLVVNTRKREVGIIYDPSRGRRTTQVQASEAGGIAAVNGGFFNGSGGSVTYIRADGIIADKDTATVWPRNENLNGAILVSENGRVTLTTRQTNGWFDTAINYPDVLVTGPVLVLGNSRAEMPSTSLVNSRHPRTAIGTAGRNRVIVVTVDGRTDQSYGLTLHQLADLMLSLGCTDAINLDGGGSTTMWISGRPHGGVVNMPCDNKIFDHEGARAVSSVVVIR